MSDLATIACLLGEPLASQPATPPGPASYPVIGRLPFLTGDGLAKMAAWAAKYGDIFQYRSFYVPVCFVSRPAAIEEVLVTRSHQYIHGLGVQANPAFLGKGLFTNEAASWRHQRRVMQPAFHQRSIRRYASLIVERTQRSIAGWRKGETIDIYRSLAALTLDVVARILFDVDIEGEVEHFAAAVRALQLRNAHGQIVVRALQHLPTPCNLRYWRSIHRAEKIVYRLIHERRSTGRHGDDLLSMLLDARDENGEPMDERQIRDEIMTVIAAAYDSTALAVAYTCYLLGRHPEAAAELSAELHQVLGDRPPTLEDLPKLTYMDCVLKESMRLYPPAPAVVREAIEDVELGGYRLSKGTHIVMSPWLTHRDARYFEAPDEFRPQRWTRRFEAQLPRFAYFPFGGGARKCIGANLARMEAALMLATVIQQIGMRPAPGFKLDLVPCINLQPRTGIQMVLGPKFAGPEV
jgi:cytochrome P450